MTQREGAPPAIVVIGGGNGSSPILAGLAEAGLAPTGILTVYDDGGSTGRLREENPGLLAFGDLRRGLAATAKDKDAADRFNERLDDGHVVGNLVLLNLMQEHGNIDVALDEAAGQLGGIRGRILPTSRDAATLILRQQADEEIVTVGEHNIGISTIIDPWGEVSLEPPVDIHPDAAEAIRTADMVVIAPGSLYTSLGAALAPQGMREALLASRAMMVAIANLEPEERQNPDGWHVADHVLVLESLIGRRFNAVLHHAGPLPNGAPPLETSASGFDDIRAKITGIPMAILREADGRVVHDGRVVARELGKLLVSQPQYA